MPAVLVAAVRAVSVVAVRTLVDRDTEPCGWIPFAATVATYLVSPAGGASVKLACPLPSVTTDVSVACMPPPSRTRETVWPAVLLGPS